MTDRELLEKAAKAVGFDLAPRPDVHAYADGIMTVLGHWSPLTNDAHAFRMMVDLRMVVGQSDGRVIARVGTIEQRSVSEPLGAAPYAATRRAIVRAAASIGPTP